jgi:hypothetical protein
MDTNYTYTELKNAIKFSTVVFGFATLFVLIEYFLVPNAYYGETLLFIWVYILNIIIGVILTPLLYLAISRIPQENRLLYLFCYFIFVIIVANIFPLFSGHLFCTVKLLETLTKDGRLQLNILFELLNPVLGFIVACLFF